MKKFISLLLILIIMLTICIVGIGTTVSAAKLSSSPESDFIAFDGVIEEYIGYASVVVIPETIDGVAVTEIASDAFRNNNDIEEVYIPEGVEVLGHRAFYKCYNLYKVELPYSLREVGTEAFHSCSLYEITIPANWEKVGYGCFMSNYNLRKIRFSYGVKEIHTGAFGQTMPRTVVFPETVELIASAAFNYVNSNNPVEFIICNPNLDLGRRAADGGLWGEMMDGKWSDEIFRPWNSYIYPDMVFICTVPEGSAIGEFIEEKEHILLDKANDPGAYNNDYYVQYKPQSYFDNLEENQDNFGIVEPRTDLIQLTCSHEYSNTCDKICNKCWATREVGEHQYQWQTDKEAGCGADGAKHEECSICHEKRNENTKIPATKKHNYTIRTTKAATCTASGTRKHTCVDCGYSYTASIPALGHNYNSGKITKKATCNATGIKTYTCVDCGNTKTKTLSKIEHTYSGSCDTSCNVCKAKRTIKHTYNSVVTTKATLTKNGKISYQCSKCGYVASNTKVIKNIKSVKLSTTSTIYNGKVKKPSVTVKDSAGKTLKKNTDYTVSYSGNCKNVGKYKVTVKFKGKYSGTKTLYFTINPPKTSILKLTAGKKSLTVKISKKTTQVSGYQIHYSTSKNFKSYKTNTLTSSSKTTKTISKLSAKKNYYVRVRTYKTVNGKKYYSGWSTVKSVKTK